MKTNTFLSILLLFVLFLQGSESQSEEYFDKASDPHTRKKRIIDTSHDRDEAFLRQEITYVVRILNEAKEIQCTGIILKPRVILTAAHCVHNRNFSIASRGSGVTNTQIHKVISKFVHPQYDTVLKVKDLALVVINKAIDLIHSFHKPIELYEGHLPPNSHGLITGWGCTTRDEQDSPLHPLSILVPILSLQQCQHAYGNRARISPREICTHSDNRQKCCWHGDSGAPLVVSGHLVGVFVCFYPSDEPLYPDVFMNLLNPDYKRWVTESVNHIVSRYRS